MLLYATPPPSLPESCYRGATGDDRGCGGV
jgi:hypothetical protein